MSIPQWRKGASDNFVIMRKKHFLNDNVSDNLYWQKVVTVYMLHDMCKKKRL